MLPTITGEFGVALDPEIRFNDKGTGWAKLRCVFKDRKRDSMGNWSDGEPNYIDVTVSQGAEHLVDSISKGDSVVVIGRFRIRTWEKDGQTQYTPEILADSIGPSTRWAVAKTARTLENTGNVAAAKETLGATEAPF